MLITIVLLGLFSPFLVLFVRKLLELDQMAIGTVVVMALVVGLYVREKLLDRKEQHEFDLEERGICSHCRYDCRGIRGDRCPECGEMIVR